MFITVKHGRCTNEAFTSTTLEREPALSQVVEALRAKGFTVEAGRADEINTAFLRVKGLRSDRAVDYACDIIRRAGRKAGFVFAGSTQHH